VLPAAHLRTLRQKIRKSPMKDNRVRFAKVSGFGAVGMLLMVLAACGGSGTMYTMTGGMTNGMGGGATGGMSTPSSVSLASPGATVNRTVSLTAMASAGTGVTISRVDFMVDGTVIGSAMMSPYSVKWDTSTVTDGAHSLTAKVTDSAGKMAMSAMVSVAVLNKPTFTVTLSPAQIYPAPASTASGTATVSVNLVTGAVSGKVMLTGVTATAVNLYEGFAGMTGGSLIMLTQNTASAGEWDLSAGAMLTADQVTALLQGGIYVQALSAANPGGEIRGQITPANITVVWTLLSGTQEVPPVTISAAGVAATTVDSVANTASVYILSTGVTDATAAELDTGAMGKVGAKLAELTKGTVNMGSWSVAMSQVTAADIANFNNGMWYLNVLTPADPNGAIRGQITPTMTPAVPTLTQLQTSVFTPKCSGCHNGIGNVPPGVLNLTAGGTYKALVNVATLEQPNLKYVVPGDPANSYLIEKLIGTAGITGGRMPLSGPYLDDATIAQVAAWVAAGAANN
jgi:mono/diheme cytochrome c family protein